MSCTLAVEKNECVKTLEKEYIKMLRKLRPGFKKRGYTFYPLSCLLIPCEILYQGEEANIFLEEKYNECLTKKLMWQQVLNKNEFPHFYDPDVCY